MIVVTHEMGFAREVADRVVFMDGGVVVEQGPPSEVISNPQHERTRRLPQADAAGRGGRTRQARKAPLDSVDMRGAAGTPDAASVLGVVVVRGRSMEPTLHTGDRLLVLRGAPPRLGRLAIVRLPDDPTRATAPAGHQARDHARPRRPPALLGGERQPGRPRRRRLLDPRHRLAGARTDPRHRAVPDPPPRPRCPAPDGVGRTSTEPPTALAALGAWSRARGIPARMPVSPPGARCGPLTCGVGSKTHPNLHLAEGNRMLSRIFRTTEVSAHCDLPCGVYDPAQARIEAESIKAIIAKVADNDDPDFRTRAVVIKEQRSELVKHHLWVLWTDYFKPPHFEKYPRPAHAVQRGHQAGRRVRHQGRVRRRQGRRAARQDRRDRQDLQGDQGRLSLSSSTNARPGTRGGRSSSWRCSGASLDRAATCRLVLK